MLEGVQRAPVRVPHPGSGRVPAAFNGLVGIKPTLGLVPTTGVVPACASFDAVTTFTADLDLGRRALRVLVGPDDGDPRSRTWAPDTPLAAPPHPVVAVPRADDLAPLCDEYRTAFAATVDALAARGVELVEVDVSPMLAAARLLYDGAFVAERTVAVGDFLSSGPPSADPTVSAIVLGGAAPFPVDHVQDLGRLVELRAETRRLLAPFDAVLLPTTTEQPTIAAVQADPVTITDVELEDGGHVVGFGCAHDAALGGLDITEAGSWPAHLAAQDQRMTANAMR